MLLFCTSLPQHSKHFYLYRFDFLSVQLGCAVLQVVDIRNSVMRPPPSIH